MLGRAPTGKTVTIAGFTMNRVAEGKIAEEWASHDTLGVMQQSGAVPTP
jgi:predicted ester cyclase